MDNERDYYQRLVEDEKQKLLYVFDYMTERCFFIELSEIITGKDMNGAKCTKKSGDAPKQTVDFEEMTAAGGSLDLDENFYGDQDFDMEDFDKEGFGGLDDGAAGIAYERRQILINRFGRISTCSNDNETSLRIHSFQRMQLFSPVIILLQSHENIDSTYRPHGSGKDRTQSPTGGTLRNMYHFRRFTTALCRFENRYGRPYPGTTATGYGITL